MENILSRTTNYFNLTQETFTIVVKTYLPALKRQLAPFNNFLVLFAADLYSCTTQRGRIFLF